ncbi:hypothetical protein SGRIM128S_07294 [Streptomyces griseomycini]
MLTDCVPSKTLIATAEVMTTFDSSYEELGIIVADDTPPMEQAARVVGVDLGKVNRRVKRLALAQSHDITASVTPAPTARRVAPRPRAAGGRAGRRRVARGWSRGRRGAERPSARADTRRDLPLARAAHGRADPETAAQVVRLWAASEAAPGSGRVTGSADLRRRVRAPGARGLARSGAGHDAGRSRRSMFARRATAHGYGGRGEDRRPVTPAITVQPGRAASAARRTASSCAPPLTAASYGCRRARTRRAPGGSSTGPPGAPSRRTAQSSISQIAAPDVTDAPTSALRPLMVPDCGR